MEVALVCFMGFRSRREFVGSRRSPGGRLFIYFF